MIDFVRGELVPQALPLVRRTMSEINLFRGSASEKPLASATKNAISRFLGFLGLNSKHINQPEFGQLFFIGKIRHGLINADNIAG